MTGAPAATPSARSVATSTGNVAKSPPGTSVAHLLERLLRIVEGSEDYFVSGSLSFLPRLPPYRTPGNDVDAALKKDLFVARREAIAREGPLRPLRLSEVAALQDSPLARVVSPRADWIHVETRDGLLDLALYTLRGARLEFRLGAGLSGSVPRAVLDRVTVLEWEGRRYRAAPPELAFLPKALWYVQSRCSRAPMAEEVRKHELDLRHMLPLIDWDFAALLLDRGDARWLGCRLPGARWLSPFRRLDLRRLREELMR